MSKISKTQTVVGTKKKFPRPLFFYEPKLVPILDDQNNVIGYGNPMATALPLSKSKNLRVITSCNERGLSCDPQNVTGFQALLDTLNQNRNLQGFSHELIGSDDLSVMERLTNSLPSPNEN